MAQVDVLVKLLDGFAAVKALVSEVTDIEESVSKLKSQDNEQVDVKSLHVLAKDRLEKVVNKVIEIKEQFDTWDQTELQLNATDPDLTQPLEPEPTPSIPEEGKSLNETDVIESSITEVPVKQELPKITLVDINKLVDPNHKSILSPPLKRNKKDSVIVLSSSDDEKNNESSYQNPKANGTIQPPLKLKINKRDILNQSSLSDSDSSERLERKKKKRGERNKSNRSKSKKTTVVPEKYLRLYIPLPRYPAEKLKEIYLKKKEDMEIKKLTDLDGLEKRRTKERNTSSEKKVQKEKVEKIKKTKTSEEESSEEEREESFEEQREEKMFSESDKEAKSDKEDHIASVIDGIEDMSDKNEENNESDSSTTVKKKKVLKKKKKTEKDDPIEDKVDESQDKDKEKDDQTSTKTDEKAESGEDTETKERNEEKKKWKKDKLLTSKLSSSDSDSDKFEKFKKKKALRDATSDEDDEDPSLNQKQKRKLKGKKRKKTIISDSDSDKKSSGEEFKADEESSSDEKESVKEEDEEVPKKPPRRKRIKKTASSSDDEDKSTRRQIRKIKGKDSLSKKTLDAEEEEKERKARILEKQKKYNQMFSASESDATVDKVVLDFDEETKEELLQIESELCKKLKPHQASGIKFMWDACFESLERTKSTKGSGCILAHCMGLGKTLQVIALSHTLLINSEATTVKKILVVCPLNTVLNWKSEFKKWIPNDEYYEVFELVSCKSNDERTFQVKEWHRCGGVMIIGYNMFRLLTNPDNKRLKKKAREAIREGLVDPGPDLVVCDEGHLLKNEKTNLSIAMNRLKTARRIVLTGTPLQNNLREYWCMVQFVKPNLLGTYKEYLNRFVNPITNGQYTDSTQHDIQVMRKRAHVLHKMLDGIVQRRDYAVLQPYLPPKHEYVLFINLTETQIKLYEYYMQNLAKKNEGSNKTSFLFSDFQQLQRICTHPRVLLDKSEEDKIKEKFVDDEESEGSLKDFIDDGSDSSSSSDSKESDGSDDDKPKHVSKARTTRAALAQMKQNGIPLSDSEPEQEKEWWQEFCDGPELENINNSGKMFLLFEILKECEQIGDKVLIFSQSLYTLNSIEYFLSRIDEATQQGTPEIVGGHSGSWALGLDYFRLDGSSSCDNRASWCDSFNNPKNTRARLFLISTRAGGLGINLVSANRVIIFDVSWNPSHDIQSIYRVYRFGQTKPCYVYRFVSYGTMEMKIYERQVTKQAISKRVIDEQQIDRHYNSNDLAELYKCDLRPENRPTPLVPKDVLLGEMLHTYDKHIYQYHEHQSLLENKEEECLNEEERKAAWEEFENEKNNRNLYNYNAAPASGISSVTISEALISIFRKDNPDYNDQQVQAILPALLQQLHQSLAAGDMTMYMRVQQEIKYMQAAVAQRRKEQFYQQQMMKLMQQQQKQNQLLGNLHINPAHLSNLLQGSTSRLPNNEVIELID